MRADDQTSTHGHGQSSSSRRRSGRHLFLLGLRLLLGVSILAALDWAFRTQYKSLYPSYGRYFLLVANALARVNSSTSK